MRRARYLLYGDELIITRARAPIGPDATDLDAASLATDEECVPVGIERRNVAARTAICLGSDVFE